MKMPKFLLRQRLLLARSPEWLKMKNPACAAVRREEKEDWGRR
jgi:hypothetical protein